MLNAAGFVFCAAVICFAGTKLSGYGDKLATLTGLGRAWIGLILMATVTSLPELSVGISSSAIVASADLAVGDVLGSCSFNLAILGFITILLPKKMALFPAAPEKHILSATLSVLLLSFAGLGIVLNNIPSIAGLSLLSLVIMVTYVISIRTIFRFESASRTIIDHSNPEREKADLRKVTGGYFLFASITITAALFIPYFAKNIIAETGLEASFMGTVFVAISTSLPEIAVSIAAVRLGAVDLAMGNIFGSNIFNVLILALDDMFYREGVLLNDASDIHLVSVFFCLAMTATAIVALKYQGSFKTKFVVLPSVLLLFLYGCNIVLIFLFG